MRILRLIKKWTLSNECNAQIRSKLPTFHNPLKRFIKSKNQREVDSEVKNINHRVIEPHVFKERDELANLDSGKYLYSWWIKITLRKKKIIFSLFFFVSPSFSLSASTLNEQSTESNTSIYRSEHHSVADAARTRESCQDLASYFSEVDPDEPTTSATNTIVLSASTFDRDVEPSKTS